MKLKSKLMAAAIALAAASGASAAIDNGSTGNGELFFNIWDANGSYTRDLNLSFSSFESTVSAAGLVHLTYTADSLLSSFFASGDEGAPVVGGTRSGALKFNVTANDENGAGVNSRRSIQTFTEPKPNTTIGSGVARNANGAITSFVNAVNTPLGANNSVAVDAANTAYAGKAAFADKAGNFLNFSNAGGIANNSYANGLSLMWIGANSLGTTASTYNQYFDQGQEIHVYLDAQNTLHIQAIPEPETYALLLAGLGMLGLIGRRRLNNRV